MNKKIKKIIAFSLATGTFATCGPLTNSNLFTTKAYASSDDADELSDIDVEDNDGDTIDLYEDKDYDDELEDDPEEGETYYGESDTKKITIDVDGADDDHVRIFKGSTEYKVGDKISLDSSGRTTLDIRVYEDDYDDDEDYSSSDYNEYTLKIEYTDDDDDDDDDDDNELTEIEIEDENGDDIDLYEDDDYDDELEDDPEEDETYYAESDTKKIKIDVDADDDYVRIFKGNTAYEVKDEISLSSGNNTLKIRVYDDEYDKDEDYSSSDYEEYTVKVNYTGKDEVALSTLSLAGASINFNKDTTSYNSGVGNTTSSITVQAIPTDGEDTVTINGTTVGSSDNYKKTINLNVGNNTVTVKVQDEDGESKTYTVTVNRSAQTVYTTPGATSNTIKTSKYGWQLVNNTWYYTYSNGTKATGWQYIGGQWYYLDSYGRMKTGWFKDTDGRWYYLQPSGAMAKNTTINGYKLGSNGAWVK